MQPAIRHAFTRDQYLELDIGSEERHEFYRGEIFAMTGGTFNHAAISGNLFSTLKDRLRGKPCQPINGDMRVHTPAGLDTYPDISIYCGRPELQDNQRTLLNPVALFEVLSPTTRDYDRGDKFSLYRSITTLDHYVLVDSESILVEHYRRIRAGEWLLHEYRMLEDVVDLAVADVGLALSEIYDQIRLEQ